MPSGGALQFYPATGSVWVAMTGPDVYYIIGPHNNTIAATFAVICLNTSTFVGTYNSFSGAVQGAMVNYLAAAT
jgi:hypothetical protein